MFINVTLRYLALALLTSSLGYFGWRTVAKLSSQPQQSIKIDGISLPGNYYTVAIPSSEKNRYLKAEYKVWIPEGIERVRGVLVKQHGCGNDAAISGLNHASDLQWQALALKHQFALMGTKMLVGEGRCEDWALINYGSRDTFLHALDIVAEQSKRDEFNQVPWILWGHSGGADWAAQMLQEYPERTIAMVGLRGGGFTFLGVNQQLTNIPVMFSLGENDQIIPHETIELPQTIFRRYRRLDALWSIAIEANAGHETANSRLIAIPYLDALITMRLVKDSNKLRSIDQTRGWLGNIVTHEIAPANQYLGNPLEAAWLPNEEIARKWQEYVTTGKVSPTRKPKAPNDVRAREIKPKEVLITWNFTPDLENGLPSFRIYRNNSLIQTFKGQSHGFGDTPKPTQIALEFRDRKANPNSFYRVVAINEIGESVSQPVKTSQSLNEFNISK